MMHELGHGAGSDELDKYDPYEHAKTVIDRETGEMVRKLYLPGIMMHELGHAAGLADLRDYPEFEDYLMAYSYDNFTDVFNDIPNSDIQYLQQNQHLHEDG